MKNQRERETIVEDSIFGIGMHAVGGGCLHKLDGKGPWLNLKETSTRKMG